MVKEVIKHSKKGKKTYFQCEECNFYYKDNKIAEKCENWCKEHKSCNIDIIKDAVRIR